MIDNRGNSGGRRGSSYLSGWGAPKEEKKMDTAVELNGKRRQLLNRAYSLILVTLIGAGVLWTLAVLNRDTSAQAQAKGGVPPASGVSDAPDCGHDWAVVSSPNPGSLSNYLGAVTAVSANDVWAVGSYQNGSPILTVTEHWDGSAWTVVSSPSPGALKGVAAISANDVWAVGRSTNGTLTEHWDGSTWSVVPSPNPGTQYNALARAAAISANDVWAVGDYGNGSALQTLTEHWNGSTWSVVSSPNPDPFTWLTGVAAISANDVWVVGY
jgi:hypothetical protein